MKVENFISNDYFIKFKKEKLMNNKEVNKRPCFFCFRDDENSNIYWFVPITHMVEKYKRIYKQKSLKQKKVLNFVFGDVMGSEKVFLIQNIFPATKKYIIEKYKNNNKDVDINYKLKMQIISYSKKVIEITKRKGNIVAFNNIIEMKKQLLEELITN